MRPKSKSKLKAKVKGKSTARSAIKSKSKSKSKVTPISPLNSLDLTDIWPQERDLMIRPDRYQYVRKLVKPDGCVFCVCAEKPESLDTLTLVKTNHSMVVMNKFPYNNGHLLVIPLRHCGDITHFSEAEYSDLMKLLRKAMQVVQKVYGCEGMNVGLNHGAVAGAGIPEHLHWHVIPRWFGDVNFFPLIAETKVVVESLESSYHRLKEAWQEVL
jgi:ATP adenylyltransferase